MKTTLPSLLAPSSLFPGLLTGLITGLLVTSAAAQEVSAPVTAKVTVQVVPAKADVLQYSITTKAEMQTETKRTINGEEGAGRGAGGPVKSAQDLVFQEGPEGSSWRHYVTASGAVTRNNRSGEEQQKKIVGALAGKKLFMLKEDGKQVFKVESAEGETLPRRVTAGVPVKLGFGGLLPGKPLAVEGTYPLKKKAFAQALRKLLHPVRAEQGARGTGAQGAGARGAGAKGAGGQGQGRRRGRGRNNAGTWNAAAMRLLNSKKLTTKGIGKLVSVSEKDGQKFATLAIDATLSGEGSPTELGLGRANRRRGGAQNQNAGNGKASVAMKVTGQILVNQTEQRIQSMSLRGTVETNSQSSRTRERNGEERKIDTMQATKGSFQIAVSCDKVTSTPESAPKKVEGSTTGK